MAIRLLPRRLIGQTIRGIRGRLGMTPAAFADAVGADGAAEVERWERGEAQPDYGVLAKIAAMGVVDVLVFHDDAAVATDTPQLTPGEASELRTIVARMEALLGEARRIVDRAADRTAVEALEAATAAPLPDRAGDTTLALVAEVAVEARPRRSRAPAAGGSTTTAKPARSRADGASARSTRSSERGNGRSSRAASTTSSTSATDGAASGGGRKTGTSRSRSTGGGGAAEPGAKS